MMWGEYIQHYCPPRQDSVENAAENTQLRGRDIALKAPQNPKAERQDDKPWWAAWEVWLGAIVAAILCVSICGYYMFQDPAKPKGSKRSNSKGSRSTRGAKLSAEQANIY